MEKKPSPDDYLMILGKHTQILGNKEVIIIKPAAVLVKTIRCKPQEAREIISDMMIAGKIVFTPQVRKAFVRRGEISRNDDLAVMGIPQSALIPAYDQRRVDELRAYWVPKPVDKTSPPASVSPPDASTEMQPHRDEVFVTTQAAVPMVENRSAVPTPKPEKGQFKHPRLASKRAKFEAVLQKHTLEDICLFLAGAGDNVTGETIVRGPIPLLMELFDLWQPHAEELLFQLEAGGYIQQLDGWRSVRVLSAEAASATAVQRDEAVMAEVQHPTPVECEPEPVVEPPSVQSASELPQTTNAGVQPQEVVTLAHTQRDGTREVLDRIVDQLGLFEKFIQEMRAQVFDLHPKPIAEILRAVAAQLKDGDERSHTFFRLSAVAGYLVSEYRWVNVSEQHWLSFFEKLLQVHSNLIKRISAQGELWVCLTPAGWARLDEGAQASRVLDE